MKFEVVMKPSKPTPAGGKPMAGLPNGTGSLWSDAGLMPRLRMRARQEGEDHLAANLIKFARLSRARQVLKFPLGWTKISIFQREIQGPFFLLRGSRLVYF